MRSHMQYNNIVWICNAGTTIIFFNYIAPPSHKSLGCSQWNLSKNVIQNILWAETCKKMSRRWNPLHEHVIYLQFLNKQEMQNTIFWLATMDNNNNSLYIVSGCRDKAHSSKPDTCGETYTKDKTISYSWWGAAAVTATCHAGNYFNLCLPHDVSDSNHC